MDDNTQLRPLSVKAGLPLYAALMMANNFPIPNIICPIIYHKKKNEHSKTSLNKRTLMSNNSTTARPRK